MNWDNYTEDEYREWERKQEIRHRKVTKLNEVQSQARETLIKVIETNDPTYIKAIADYVRDNTFDLFNINQFLYQRVFRIENGEISPNTFTGEIDLSPIYTAIVESNKISKHYEPLCK